eukprot:g868.t1
MPPSRAAAIAAAKRKKSKVSDGAAKGAMDSLLSEAEHLERLERKMRKEKRISQRLSISPCHMKLVQKSRALRDNTRFQTFIIAVIFAAGAMVGIQTYPTTDIAKLKVYSAIDAVILWIFVLEVVVKMAAEGRRPWIFFTDSWNIFDFFIVVIGFLPIGGGGAVTALRLLRLLRVLKLVKALPKLRILVMGLLASLSSIGYIGVLLLLAFYLFAVLGVGMFGENDPVHMGTLHIAILSEFRAATLEDWTDLMYISMYGCEYYGYEGMMHLCVNSQPQGTAAALFWVAFVILSSMMILNLFIGVIASSMEDAKETLSQENDKESDDDSDDDEEDGDGNENAGTVAYIPIKDKLVEIEKVLSACAEELLVYAKKMKDD